MTAHRKNGGKGADIWCYSLFGAVALYSLYILIFYVSNCRERWLYSMPLLFLALFSSWFSTRVTLFVFAGSIPFISGISFRICPLPFNILNAIFAAVYLAWFVRHIFLSRKDIRPRTQAGFFIDLLSSVILLSLFSVLILYPFDYWTGRIWHLGSLSKAHELYGIHASYIFLQGLFFFRLLEINDQPEKTGRFFRYAFCAQACTILLLAGYQVFLGDTTWMDAPSFRNRGIYLPLDDIHSYGSFLILLLSVFLFSIKGASGSRKWMNVGVTVLLIFCVVLSFSRAAYLALLFVFVLYLGSVLNRKKVATFAVVLCVLSMGLFVLLPEKWRVPSTSYTLGHFKTTHTFMYRIFRWRVSLDMIKTAPLTGLGMGGHYRLYPYYSKDADLPDEWRTPAREGPENAHHYFIQFASDLGIPTLFLLIFVLLLAFFRAFKAHPKSREDGSMRNGLMAGVAGYLFTCLLGHPLLLSNQQFLFWFAVAGMSLIPTTTGDFRVGYLYSRRTFRISIAVFVTLLLAGYLYKGLTFREWRGFELGYHPHEQRDVIKVRCDL